MNDRLNMAVVPSEVIWKWQQYENTFIAVFPLSPIPSKMFYNLLLTIDLQAVEIKVTFNEISFEQSDTSSFNNECPPKSGKMDFAGLIQSR